MTMAAKSNFNCLNIYIMCVSVPPSASKTLGLGNLVCVSFLIFGGGLLKKLVNKVAHRTWWLSVVSRFVRVLKGGLGLVVVVPGGGLQGLLLLLLLLQLLLHGLVEVLGTALVVIVRGESLGLGGCLLLLVGLLVEVVEQEVEEDGVGQGEAHGPPRIAAVRVQQLGLVDEGAAELDL